jgi:hypothetical protein
VKRLGSIASLTTAMAACTLLPGCMADRVNGLRAAATEPAPRSEAVAACPFTITAIDDHREQKNLGILIRTQVDGDSFPAWFSGGLKAIPGYAPQEAPVSIRVEVIRAYIHALSTMKSANLVVRVHTTARGEPPRTKVYRGVDGSVNWSNSESEVQTAFDNAMRHLQDQMRKDLWLTCH